MTSPSHESDESGGAISRLRGLLLVEFAALVAALAAPLIPSRTGSGFTDPAGWLFEDPSYPANVAVAFLMVNAVVGVVGVIVGVSAKRAASRSE